MLEIKEEDLQKLFDKATQLKKYDISMYRRVIKHLGKPTAGDWAYYMTEDGEASDLYLALAGLWFGKLMLALNYQETEIFCPLESENVYKEALQYIVNKP